ncbi:AraC family transcriptional regulator [Burkholderia ubonensis]|uniref:AraC family transcriptional regulator n=1 Tax=Burkholderia ubonensis TaxID=101571 RepID=UPI0022B76584|nr:AraC family transcriptional regulator [Burkholderia ubonensis]
MGEQVGYGDLSTFRQLFKRRTGLSPSEYQRRFAQSLEPGVDDDSVDRPARR